ncbi:hypothetical protein VN12_06350 [Pirellula sp. SH-Sr6A]|uniref:hypothetical protein n=1 Tax=Pirellula sp. SH-Sr6A TaxID=1632865 RepID=UPI00078BDCB5|nr:hypothetical protein [Pirellula sp. SH-Sr6A]AMV31723.1 hypothetical protein VN12_06350 [Pirellula sp. SH-Sr6A]
MSEVRSALPYISHLRVTKRPTIKWEPIGYDAQNGEDLYRQGVDLPGIECEVTPYMGSVKGPAATYRFPLKAFFEANLAKLQAKPQKNDQDNAAIANLQATIANPETIWAESILLAGGLPTLTALWQDVFSDALDEFTEWSEPEVAAGGIPLYVREMQWDARIPYESAKSITLKVGLFDTEQEEGAPALYTLSFEDAATRAQREAYNAQLVQRITQLTAAIAGLPEGPSETRTQMEQELAGYQAEKAQRDAVENGLMSDLLSNASVQQSLPTLLVAILGALKAVYWPDLDMSLVQTRLAETLGELAVA